ncbi:hypothetical protein IG626_09535 [Desulfovibrio desulfuricans]|uniref:hypothetical protein n=1 Tax=Desulfovibrio desulfuricans TaxID=876 RepID=UPI00177E4FB6|nr:hypothetical protein [Desulfovibrio desulfuricans]MBD8896243.1 hypothetical protein [Desulfovibrio desulfuricans]
MNSLGLAPCPNHKCGSSDCLVLQVKDRFWAFCTVCNCDGPNAESVEAAKAAWDELPRMSTIIAWQFQAAGLALENQRLRKMVAALEEQSKAEKNLTRLAKVKRESDEGWLTSVDCTSIKRLFKAARKRLNAARETVKAVRRAVEGK